MGGIKRLLTIVLTIPLLLTLFGCENALTTYIFQALFAPPVPPAYINQVAKLAPEDDAASFVWSVDIDGDSGGYNLQWAWSSGFVAGIHAAESIV